MRKSVEIAARVSGCSTATTLIGSSPRSRPPARHPACSRAPSTRPVARSPSSDGERLSVDGVIWATGFRVDHSLVARCRCSTTTGRAQHRRGVTATPGLYFLGLQWQYTRGSALLGWVKDDARHIAEQIAAHQRTQPARLAA